MWVFLFCFFAFRPDREVEVRQPGGRGETRLCCFVPITELLPSVNTRRKCAQKSSLGGIVHIKNSTSFCYKQPDLKLMRFQKAHFRPIVSIRDLRATAPPRRSESGEFAPLFDLSFKGRWTLCAGRAPPLPVHLKIHLVAGPERVCVG